MTGDSDPDPRAVRVQELYTRRRRSYEPYVQAFGHRQGIQAVLESSPLLRSGERILDAGCGSGLSLAAIARALRRRGYRYQSLHGFDLTLAMLEQCRETLRREGIGRAELRQADVTRIGQQLPAEWAGYDLILCASMMEYVPREHLASALAALRARLAPGGHLLLIVTRKSFLPTQWAWQCGGYTGAELRSAFDAAGFRDVRFRHYPPACAWLNVADHVIEAGTGEDLHRRAR
jgi:SAM-dependent methyltransferase